VGPSRPAALVLRATWSRAPTIGTPTRRQFTGPTCDLVEGIFSLFIWHDRLPFIETLSGFTRETRPGELIVPTALRVCRPRQDYIGCEEDITLLD
jgi:hypothetical protein